MMIRELEDRIKELVEKAKKNESIMYSTEDLRPSVQSGTLKDSEMSENINSTS